MKKKYKFLYHIFQDKYRFLYEDNKNYYWWSIDFNNKPEQFLNWHPKDEMISLINSRVILEK